MAAENQEQAKPKEREIPVFTVLKNNCILKNIFLLDNPPSVSPPSDSVAEENVDQEFENEEILMVGRHPDCNIKLEHPSISRFHLRIHSKPYSRSLFVIDLSSAHGTWISGKRIDPGVTMKLNKGDTLQLGASSRLYQLNWVPLSRAYDIDNPFVPQVDGGDTIDEETEGKIDQEGNSLSYGNDQVQTLSDDMEGINLLFSEENQCSSMEKNSPTLHLIPEDDLDPSVSNEEELENSILDSAGDELSNSQVYRFEEENRTPRAHFLSGMSQPVSQLETTEISGMNLEKRSGLSIWSRRGKPESVQIETRRSRGYGAMISMNFENNKCESILKDHHDSSVNEEETFILDKENTPPSSPLVRSLKNKDEETLKSKSISSTSISLVDRDEEEIFTPDKENVTPNKENTYPRSLMVRSLKSKDDENLKIISISKTSTSRVDQDEEEIFTQDKENMTPKSRLLGKFEGVKHLKLFSPDTTSPSSLLDRSLKGKDQETLKSKSISNSPVSRVDQDEEEIFTPDKENMTPKSHLRRSMKNGKSECRPPKLYRSSPLKTADNSEIYPENNTNQHRKVFQKWDSTSSASKSRGSLKKQPTALKARADRDPFRPLPINSTSNHKPNPKPKVHEDTTTCSRSVNYPESEEVNHSHHNTMKVENKRWIIVVDTCCVMNKKSRRELQLLQGLRGTTLIIPRIVVRELDCLLRRRSFFTRMTEVSAALQWIKDCMAEAKWWIHVQTSAEEGLLIPPTPPASSPRWFSEGKGAFSVGSIPFSPYSLQEIVTPTAADHILECALFFKRNMNEGQLVLLSDNVTLKIKAIAEGVFCETAEEFRGSLVNPFSERFLYSNSSPVGPTWSCVDDAVLKERYYPSPSKRQSKSGEVAKGLKLILLHNSSFRQITPIS